jgi:hypothetical protein
MKAGKRLGSLFVHFRAVTFTFNWLEECGRAGKFLKIVVNAILNEGILTVP